MHEHFTVSLYYVRHCCIELRAPLCLFTVHNTLYATMYRAFIVHSVFSVGFSINITKKNITWHKHYLVYGLDYCAYYLQLAAAAI